MGRETHLIPVEWEREPFEWKKVKDDWPVCAPNTGRVERSTPLPFTDRPQYRNDAFYDDFDSPVPDLEWNFRRVPMEQTYSLKDREGYLRLFLKPEVIRERGRCSLMGFRQKESDFEYTIKMIFTPKKEGAEAGISLFQQDHNYINFTIAREGGNNALKLVVNERRKDPEAVKEEILTDYTGAIMLRVESKDRAYHYSYSLDQGQTFVPFAETAANLILSHGYTGAYLGVYATSNGRASKEYADFDWIHYKGHQRF
jgi:alpha-N-arabinofuranosidase